jgi:tetratricopeptide (TPR) repeat protein
MQSGVLPQFQGTRRFQLRRRVGQGAVGVVYEAWDEELHARIALKTLRAVGPDALLSLKKDFRAVQDIRHPNLVKMGELVEEGGTWFFTMEFVDGLALRRYVRPIDGSRPSIVPFETPAQIASAPRYDEARLRSVLPQLVEALNALHAHGKVHRDVKPSNVLVTDAGRLVLLDFGVAFDLGRDLDDAAGDLVGTVAYMAPEQAMSETIGPAADWYAVGVILYEALTGRLPFYGQMHDLLAKKLRGAPPDPATLVSGLPDDLRALCVDLLRVAPGDRPDGREILTRLGVAARQEPGSGGMKAAAFVGRVAELGALEGAFADVRDGRTVTVLVDGESGVGKSFLVRHFLANVENADGRTLVLAGRCFERESVPYKALDGIVDQLREHLAALNETELAAVLPLDAYLLTRAFPVLGDVVPKRDSDLDPTANPQTLRARMFMALRKLFERVGARCHLVLSIDDLQWADKDSLELIAELTRPPDAPRLLLVATIRMASEQVPLSVSGRTEALEVVGDVRHVQVHQLAHDEARALARSLVSKGTDESTIEEIVSESKGHPLFIDELVRQRASIQSPKVLRLDDALWSRVTRLERQVQRLLELLAVAGLPIAQGLAAESVGVELGELAELAAELRGAHLAKTSGARREDVIEIYHDRVRQAVLGHLEAETRALWHGRLAAALERVGSDDAESLSVHWRGVGDVARAATYAERAADAAMQTLAFERAARLYRSAIEMAPHADEAARSLEQRLAEALMNAGYVAEAGEVNLALAERARGDEAIDLRRRAAEQLLCSGRFEPGLVVLRSVLDAVKLYFPGAPAMVLLSLIFYRFLLAVRGLGMRGSATPNASTAARVRADVAWSAGSGFAMTDNVRGAYFQTRNLVLCLKLGDRVRVSRALAMEVCFRSSGGSASGAQTASLLATARQMAAELGDPEVAAMMDAAEGYHHFMLGRWRGAVDALARAESTFRDRCVGVTFQINSVRSMLYRALALVGRLEEIATRVPPVLRDAEKQADLFAIANVRSGPMVLLGLRDDEAARAREQLDEANARLPRDAFLVQHYYALLAECQLDLYGRDGAAALGRLHAAQPALRRSLLLRVQTIRVQILEARARAALAAALSRTSARSELLTSVEKSVVQLEGENVPWAHALATMLHGGLSAARGDVIGASKTLEGAEAQLEAVDMPLHAAACRLRRGELETGDDGERLIREASARLEAEGARKPERMAGLYLPRTGAR